MNFGRSGTKLPRFGFEDLPRVVHKALLPRLGHVLSHRCQQRLRIKSYGHANIQPHPTPPAFGPGQPTDHTAALILVNTPRHGLDPLTIR